MECTALSPTARGCCQRAVPGASCSRSAPWPRFPRGSETTAPPVLPRQAGPAGIHVPTHPGARATAWGARRRARAEGRPRTCPRARAQRRPAAAARTASRSRSPHRAPFHQPRSSRRGARSCQRFSSAPAAAARGDDASGARR